MNIVWNIPAPERTLKRMEELQFLIDNFPDSPLLICWKNALEAIKKQPV